MTTMIADMAAVMVAQTLVVRLVLIAEPLVNKSVQAKHLMELGVSVVATVVRMRVKASVLGLFVPCLNKYNYTFFI